MTDKAPGYDSQGVPTIGTRIQALEVERDKLLVERDKLLVERDQMLEALEGLVGPSWKYSWLGEKEK